MLQSPSPGRIQSTISGHPIQHQEAISINKYDLGLAKNYKHQIHLKNENLVYRKQFKIPEAHHNLIEQTLEEWLKLGVVRRSDSLYNSPIFCMPKKTRTRTPDHTRF